MAFGDALFQLGMDLTRSSTAQKEDHGVAARTSQRVKSEQRIGEGSPASTQSVGVSTNSQHVVVDLIGADGLDSIDHVQATLKWAAAIAGSELTHVHLHKLASTGGVAGIVTFANSDISVRTWPETGRIEVDALIGQQASWRVVVDSLQKAFGASSFALRQKSQDERELAQSWSRSGERKVARSRKAKAA